MKQADHAAQLAQHAHQLLLNELEAGNWLLELLSLESVGMGSFECAGSQPSGHPSNHEPRSQQDYIGAGCEVFGLLKLVVVRNKDVIQININVLDHRKRSFVKDLVCFQSLGSLLNDESLNLVPIVLILGPDDNVVSHTRIPNPPFLSINNISSICFLGRSFQTGCVTTKVRLSESPAQYFVELCRSWQNPLLLLFVPQMVDGVHA
mmetsp:Transcript_41863/g.30737  ORF Transcript_41863/g.30737 Transcript_41863/m.30737 type:complete len:206 (-) Transcript_41863:366-983(-)